MYQTCTPIDKALVRGDMCIGKDTYALTPFATAMSKCLAMSISKGFDTNVYTLADLRVAINHAICELVNNNGLHAMFTSNYCKTTHTHTHTGVLDLIRKGN